MLSLPLGSHSLSLSLADTVGHSICRAALCCGFLFPCVLLTRSWFYDIPFFFSALICCAAIETQSKSILINFFFVALVFCSHSIHCQDVYFFHCVTVDLFEWSENHVCQFKSFVRCFFVARSARFYYGLLPSLPRGERNHLFLLAV